MTRGERMRDDARVPGWDRNLSCRGGRTLHPRRRPPGDSAEVYALGRRGVPTPWVPGRGGRGRRRLPKKVPTLGSCAAALRRRPSGCLGPVLLRFVPPARRCLMMDDFGETSQWEEEKVGFSFLIGFSPSLVLLVLLPCSPAVKTRKPVDGGEEFEREDKKKGGATKRE